jgi:hypothetical protein
VFKLYINQCDEKDKISLSKFNSIWLTNLNHIKIQKARTDVCKTCRLLTNEIMEKRERIRLEQHHEFVKSLSFHLDLVKEERAIYKKVIDEASKFVATSAGINAPNSKDIVMHYSFDYAQQIHIPNDPLQPGPMFFLVPYKIQVFGIANEAFKTQHNYLNPESCTISKGSDSVISFLHHYFEVYGVGEQTVVLHADNCGGHNKNRFIMNYFAYRVMKKLHSSITIIFMPVGHTKFYYDLAFGLLKKKFKHTQVSNLKELEECIRKSTPNSNLNKSQIVGNESGKEVYVKQYSWSSWFDSLGFSKIPGIRKLHYFKFDSKKPNFVSVKANFREEYVEIKLNKETDIQSFPDEAIVPKLSIERKKYLFDKIRKYCNENSKEILCPEPTRDMFVPSTTATLETTTRGTPRVRKIGICSKCKEPGHYITTCTKKD